MEMTKLILLLSAALICSEGVAQSVQIEGETTFVPGLEITGANVEITDSVNITRFRLAGDCDVSVSGAGTALRSVVMELGNAENRLSISNGALAALDTLLIGSSETSSNNWVVVQGADSKLSCVSGLIPASSLSPLYEGTSSAHPYRVFSVQGTEASGSASFDEYPFAIIGAGENLVVGEEGSSNRLEVLDGAVVSAYAVVVGLSTTATHNAVLVSGENSRLQVQNALMLGGHYSGTNWVDGGAGNSLTVEDGGWVVIGDVNSNSLSGVRAGLVVSDADGLAELLVANGSTVNAERLFIGVGTNESGRVEITGSNTVWNGSSVSIGGLYGSENELVISDGAQVNDLYGSIGSFSELSISNSATVTGAGTLWRNTVLLYVGFGGDENQLNILDGGRVETVSAVLSSGNKIIVDGAESALIITNGFNFGVGGANNEMLVSHGGVVEDGSVLIGSASGADSNLMVVAGAGSKWNTLGDFYVGGHFSSSNWVAGGVGNTLCVGDGGEIAVGGNMENHNHTLFGIGPGALVTVSGNYYQDATSILNFGVTTNSQGVPVAGLLTVSDAAEFELGAQMVVASNVGELNFDAVYTNKLVEASLLIVAGVTNATSVDLEALDASESLVDVVFLEDDQDIFALVGRKALSESAGFSDGTMLAEVSTELDRMSLLGRAGAQNMINLLNTMNSDEQKTQIEQQFSQSAPVAMHAQGLVGGLGEVKQHMRAAGPVGPGGPAF